MKSVNIELKLNDEQKAYRDECIAFCKQNNHVKKFLCENKLDESFVENHSSTLKKWVNDCEKCSKCQGLDSCTFNHGKVFDLVMSDGILTNVYRKCRYLKNEEEKNEYLKNYVYFHGNEEMKCRDFSMVDVNSEDSKAINGAIKSLLLSVDEVKGLYLCGNPGIGKTFLLNCLANHFVHKKMKVAFVNSPTLISELKNGFNENGLIESTLSKLKKCDVLILDDIGGESITNWSRDEILMPLLNERMEKRLKTYFTSNYRFEELENHFSIDSKGNKDVIKANRLMERVKALSREKSLKGVNRRL